MKSMGIRTCTMLKPSTKILSIYFIAMNFIESQAIENGFIFHIEDHDSEDLSSSTGLIILKLISCRKLGPQIINS